MRYQEIFRFVQTTLGHNTGKGEQAFHESTPLVGAEAALSSFELVELLLAVEDFVADHFGVTFNWAHDAAMAEATSSFRTIGTLASHIAGLS